MLLSTSSFSFVGIFSIISEVFLIFFGFIICVGLIFIQTNLQLLILRLLLAIIAGGIIPAGMEIMDKALIQATEKFSKAGYPLDAEAIMIVELDGTDSDVTELLKKIADIGKKNNCTTVKISNSEEERLKFWSGRKAAFPACGEMAPDYYCVDGTIPVSYTHLTLPTKA